MLLWLEMLISFFFFHTCVKLLRITLWTDQYYVIIDRCSQEERENRNSDTNISRRKITLQLALKVHFIIVIFHSSIFPNHLSYVVNISMEIPWAHGQFNNRLTHTYSQLSIHLWCMSKDCEGNRRKSMPTFKLLTERATGKAGTWTEDLLAARPQCYPSHRV